MKGKINYFRKVALICTFAFGILVFNKQTLFAQEANFERISTASKETDSIEIVDENGNVMAIYTPYSETNPAPTIMPRYAANIDWNIGKGSHRGSSQFNMNTNTKINVAIKISPNASSNIGLYDCESGVYGYPATSESTTGWNGTITPSRSGLYSIAIRNNTNGTVNYKGTFSL